MRTSGDRGAARAPVCLRLGTRGSTLALAQSGLVAEALRALGAAVELVTVRTAGDDQPPDAVWGEGAFVTALEAALLDGRIDVAVHSAKDVPTTEDLRLRIAAYPPREDPRDALVALDPEATLDALPPGTRVGTDSPRRVAFLLARRPDLRPHPLHGNVDTRLRRLETGETGALVLAVAGLSRLGLAGRISQVLPADIMPPAPGQGALAVQCRADDATARAFVEQLDDPATRAAVEAERSFLAASGGGCRAPLGALATATGGILELVAGAAAPGAVPEGDVPAVLAATIPGTTFTGRGDRSVPVPVAWGRRTGAVARRGALAAELAAELAAALGGVDSPAFAEPRLPRVLVTRDAGQAGPLVDALRDRGVSVVHVPTIAIEPSGSWGPLDAAVTDLGRYAWVLVTSANGAASLGGAARRRGMDLAGARFAAVGAATARALGREGGRPAFVPTVSNGVALAEQLPLGSADRVLVVRGDLTDGVVADRLRARGAQVEEVIAYRTIEAPAGSAAGLREAVRSGLDGIVFTSGSTVRGLVALLDADDRAAVLRLPACCIGPSTAAAAGSAGFERVLEAPAQDVAILADVVAGAVGGSPATRSGLAGTATELP